MSRQISLIGVPMDFGQDLRGVDMGPAAVRYTGLITRLRELGHTVRDRGDVPIPIRDEAVPGPLAGNTYVEEISRICNAVYTLGRRVMEEKDFPLFVGGDHSIAVGTVAAAGADGEPIGLIWLDAHGDFNTPDTSPSGNIHGMPLAILMGEGHPDLVNVGRPGPKVLPENVVMIGLRDIDPVEKKRLKTSGVTVFTMRDIDEQGISTVANKAVMKFAHMKRIHLTVDMDALDPVEAPGVGTPVPGGITYREAHLLMEILADSKKVGSMDLVEINPILDVANKTAKLAVELTLSALGKSIL
ncbi:arginase [Desulfotignum phosphitoxidans]|uniref:Arginase n=1 Tax=Desulfotignum phosphitoxidans DSM 13687 TaxID=1286635 RepID=S0G6H1_9BACT|nr:arginase [Desulfotignum phosphitoxidans]EMS80061.1 arginase RocF [Desulfotignum phosphitoxidans DSM 13687]